MFVTPSHPEEPIEYRHSVVRSGTRSLSKPVVLRTLTVGSLAKRTHCVSEDSRPHEVDHLGHLVDVDHPFVLQLLGQRGEGAEGSGGHGSVPASAQRCKLARKVCVAAGNRRYRPQRRTFSVSLVTLS